ncbi:hypothetical protein Acr_00g0049620 [Actinidia rufa]|uniref:Potassium transporter n=1 Tax=Actinidia rufa TaxID=165716 RepID=A0A7J0DLX8_9ERIC|nr:hypothetical protein Acr_00g0049620 [Actinidia rufa]
MDSESPPPLRRLKWYKTLCLAYQSFGVVYGDLSTSPIYVYKSTFSRSLRSYREDAEILGVLSLIFWTLTLIPLFKYIVFVLAADDNGEGGTFALYSLLCRHLKAGLLSISHGANRHISIPSYNAGTSVKETTTSLVIKDFIEKHQSSRVVLLLVVLLGTSMVIGDGILTPTMSVLSAVNGIRIKSSDLHGNYIVIIACLILVSLFALQHYGTHRVGFLFAPILISWLLCLSGVGIYNIICWNPHVVYGLSPHYAYNFFKKSGKDGWNSLGGVVLCITGAEAMFADLGHFSQPSIRIAFMVVVYPSLVLAYMGEAAYLTQHRKDLQSSFYKAIPVVIGVRDTDTIGNAYGLAVITVMFVTTCLMFLVISTVWNQNVLVAALFVVIFGSVELLYFSACIAKVHKGGWLPLLFSLIILTLMVVWQYGTSRKQVFEIENKVSFERLLSISPSLGIVRVPGIALVYSSLAATVPPTFAHFVINFPALHQILIFVTLESSMVPKVHIDKIPGIPVRLLFSKAIAQNTFQKLYGYKDARDSYNLETQLIEKVSEFLQSEDRNEESAIPSAVVGHAVENEVSFGGSRRRKTGSKSLGLREEVRELVDASEAGVAYMLGNTYITASEASPIIKKFAINVVYGFLRRNSRRPAIALGIPHSSLLEVALAPTSPYRRNPNPQASPEAMAQRGRTNSQSNRSQRDPNRLGPQRNHPDLLSLYSLLCSLGMIWAIRYKTDVERHLEKLLEREREREDGQLLGKCVEELKKKGIEFDLLKEVDALRRAKSLRVEAKAIQKWSARDFVTLFLFSVSCLILGLTRVILCN